MSISPFAMLNKRTVRATPNPLDKATIVSIYPKDIHERNHTIQPGVFNIPAGTYEKPSIVVIGPSSWWKDVGEDQPLIEIPVSAIQIADSVIKDYSNGLLACNMSDSKPGLFFLPGDIGLTELKTKHSALLDAAQLYQRNWYKSLVKMADVLWSRTNRNPLAVSDDMRLAARELNISDKEWLMDFRTAERIPCKACGFLNAPGYPVCSNCRAIIDEKRAKELDIKFAG